MSRMDQRNNSPKTNAQTQAQREWKARKKQQAQALKDRQEARAKRTPQEQLAVLDARFGVGMGAKKERARLQKLIEQN